MGCGRMNGKCEYAYRKNGDVSLHCRYLTQNGARHDWCAHQYLCGRTRRWEVSEGAYGCDVRKEKKK